MGLVFTMVFLVAILFFSSTCSGSLGILRSTLSFCLSLVLCLARFVMSLVGRVWCTVCLLLVLLVSVSGLITWLSLVLMLIPVLSSVLLRPSCRFLLVSRSSVSLQVSSVLVLPVVLRLSGPLLRSLYALLAVASLVLSCLQLLST
jgi:hypothetical protein